MKLSDVMSAATGLSAYAEVALLIFMGVFVGVVLDLYFSGHRNTTLQFLPLEDDASTGRAELVRPERP